MVTNFETEAGIVTRGATYAKLMDHLREAQDCCSTLAHLHNTEGTDKDKVLAMGWLMISELLKAWQEKVTKMAMGRMN